MLIFYTLFFRMPIKTETLHQAENAVLGRVLRRALSNSGIAFPSSADGPSQILDLACGSCREAETLVEVFREMKGGTGPVRFVGADIRHREIDEAAARARGTEKIGDTFEFLVENCAELSRHSQLGGDFDAVFLRHQNYWNDQPVWHRIFEQGLGKLRNDGLMVITSYFDREHEMALQALERAGAELVVSERNESSRLLTGTAGKSVDRHLAVFRRKR